MIAIDMTSGLSAYSTSRARVEHLLAHDIETRREPFKSILKFFDGR